MMNSSTIFLNFLEVKPKEFNVTFYRKKLELIPEEEQRSYYIRNINETDNSVKKEKFALVFEEKEGFELKCVSQKFDIDITKQYLFFILLKKLKNIQTFSSNKDKYHRIYLILNKHTEGTETVWLEPYFLSQTNSFGFLLDYKFFANDEYIKNISGSVDKRILQLSGTLNKYGSANKEFYQFKNEKLTMFFSKYFQSISILENNNEQFQISNKLIELKSFLLNPKTYQFFEDKEHNSPYFGLQNNPPLQKPVLQTNFLFVFKENDRNIAIELLKGLEGKSSPSTFLGIEKMFKIPFNNNCIKGKKVSEINTEVLNDIVLEIENSKANQINLLPIILTNSKIGVIDEKLYYTIKNIFTSKSIPCQVVTKDLVNNSNTLKYSLSNIGLQIFAKSGGKPWKIKPAINDCLIIGIGNKNKVNYIKLDNNKYEKHIEKYLTYSVLTDSSGIFKEIQILSESNDEEDYYKKLIIKLETIIKLAIKEGNKNIVIHTPFRISKDKVWNKIFKDISNEINITIIIINDKHKFFGFDFSKNALVPYESSCVAISETEYLVWFEGLQYNNAAFSKPIGSPIYINFWYSNNIDNLKNVKFRNSLLQDCINLSGANWRGFKAKQLPVSIYYCQKISEFLKKFEEYNLENIQFENLKPWFL